MIKTDVKDNIIIQPMITPNIKENIIIKQDNKIYGVMHPDNNTKC
jgi:hypothetical protein